MRRNRLTLGFLLLVMLAGYGRPAWAGEQRYESMAASVRSVLAASIGDYQEPTPIFDSDAHKASWLAQMGARLPKRWKPTERERTEFLLTMRYEAQRAGLDPAMVLGLIEVESNFRRYAISSAGARGYMQVMPFWTELLGKDKGDADADASALFDMRTNLRYGCTILRHYINIEKGDLFRALGRYNGSLGRATYPNKVLKRWQRWEYKTDKPAIVAPG